MLLPVARLPSLAAASARADSERRQPRPAIEGESRRRHSALHRFDLSTFRPPSPLSAPWELARHLIRSVVSLCPHNLSAYLSHPQALLGISRSASVDPGAVGLSGIRREQACRALQAEALHLYEQLEVGHDLSTKCFEASLAVMQMLIRECLSSRIARVQADSDCRRHRADPSTKPLNGEDSLWTAQGSAGRFCAG